MILNESVEAYLSSYEQFNFFHLDEAKKKTRVTTFINLKEKKKRIYDQLLEIIKSLHYYIYLCFFYYAQKSAQK